MKRLTQAERLQAPLVPRVLVVEGEPELAPRLDRLLAQSQARIVRESSAEFALSRLELEAYDLVVVSGPALDAGRLDRAAFLEQVFGLAPEAQVLLLVTGRDVQIAKAAVRAKGCRCASLLQSDTELRTILDATLPAAGQGCAGGFGDLIGTSPAMLKVYEQLRQVADTEIPVLILGETGTGKELATAAIHWLSRRREGPYIPVNLAALPSDLVASELFGHERGAFTGANERRIGKFELADRGTILLDEIDSVDEKVQVSLLRILEQREFYRLGGKQAVTSDARLVAATNRDLPQSVEQGSFRSDLYYRLEAFSISLPPLREREGDIRLLSEAFVGRSNQELGKCVRGIAPPCMEALESYPWPGNIRELRNVIQRAVLVCDGDELLPDHLPERVGREPRRGSADVTFEIGTSLQEVEEAMIRGVLAKTMNNRKRAAELLGITRRALYGKLSKHGIGTRETVGA